MEQQAAAGSAGPAPRHRFDNRFPPPIVMLVTSGAMMGASYLLPVQPLPFGVRAISTAAALLLAGSFGAPAFSAFARAGTTINPVRIDAASSLVTGGIYRLSRNPMYVGLTALLAALAFWLGNAWLFVGPLAFAAFITRFQIIPEERVMQAKFGDAFTAYRRRVRRWL